MRSQASRLSPWALVALAACVPPGSAPPYDAGAGDPTSVVPAVPQAPNVLKTIWEDNFERPNLIQDLSAAAPALAANPIVTGPGADGGKPQQDAGTSAKDGGLGLPLAIPAPSASARPIADPFFNPLGPDWNPVKTNAWRIENGKLCGKAARNHGVWMTRPIPINARIEFEATTDSAEGDLKAEVWGDGRSAATTVSYNNATSYLVIYGGWKNTIHAIARLDEHGANRKEIKVDRDSDDPREHPVSVAQAYKFKVERSDGKTVRWFVNGQEYLNFADQSPLSGIGHDHFAFNDWDAHVCFDNVRVTPL